MTTTHDASVKSPCTSVCKMDERSGWCLGCMRTIDEIAGWSVLDEAAKRRIGASLDVRRAQFEVAGPKPR
ncbi:MAG: DUF1289 domain-containing protein [Bacteriovorax sp.]|nr:DUF1289 domain-containing protein [Rhizobacter sp.]